MNQTLSHHSRTLTRWHFLIASFFESSKYFHQIGLCALLPAGQYGLLGTLFSLAYFSAHICTLETGTAVLACIQNHKTTNLAKSLLNTLIKRPILQHTLGALCVIAYARHHVPFTLAFLTGCIAFTEGMRITIRPLLYASTPNTRIAQGEAALSFIYIIFIWLSLYMLPTPMSTQYLVGWYAAASACGLGYLILQGKPLFTSYQGSVAHLPPTRITGMRQAQTALVLLHIPHNLFSANFLVPFFAHHTSLHTAGILKITSELASAVKSILKSSISFPLHTLMLQYTEHTADITQNFIQSTNTIIPRATQILIIFTAVCSVIAGASNILVGVWLQNSVVMFLGFCILTSADYLCIPYELLSMYRNKIFTAALIRGVEVVCNLLILILCAKHPIIVVCGIASIRFLTWRVLVHESTSAPPSFLQD